MMMPQAHKLTIIGTKTCRRMRGTKQMMGGSKKPKSSDARSTLSSKDDKMVESDFMVGDNDYQSSSRLVGVTP